MSNLLIYISASDGMEGKRIAIDADGIVFIEDVSDVLMQLHSKWGQVITVAKTLSFENEILRINRNRDKEE